jgi:hypothetical protein
MAIKRRKVGHGAKAKVPKAKVPGAKAKPVAAVPKPVAAVPKPVAKAVAGPPPGVPPPDVVAPKAEPRVLVNTRKCVHSRAYDTAKRAAKLAGLSPKEMSAVACKAGKEAAEKWDLEHA